MDETAFKAYCNDIFNFIEDGLMVVGCDGAIITVNSAMERLSGYDRDALVGSKCSVLNCDACERMRKVDSKWCMLFERGAINRKRCLFMKKDGTYLSALKKATVLKDDKGQVMGAIETFTDLAEIDKRDQQIEQLSLHLASDVGFCGIVGECAPMLRLFNIIEKAAESDAPVFIYGESGTGKELVARAIHDLGRRREGPYVQFNCAALNESLFESELFGHVKGAFTGAYRHRIGRFEAAHTGDIFLDEIGDIPLSTQAKLLRVLETRMFERVGDHKPISVDVRIICATNRNLSQLVAEGQFREDLFYRINVIPIHIPPLRQRKEEIPLLTRHFISKLGEKTGKQITGISPDVMARFMRYDWPGNIRELKSVLEYAFVVAEPETIHAQHLPEHFGKADQTPVADPISKPRPGTTAGAGLQDAPPASGDDAPDSERQDLVKALRKSGGNKSQAAKLLGVHRMTVWNRMKKYGIALEKEIRKAQDTA